MRKDYRHYNLEDFLADEEFRRWVLKPDDRLDYFWKKMISSHPEQLKTIKKAREFILLFHFTQAEVTDKEKEEILHNIIRKKRSDKYLDAVREGKSRVIWNNWRRIAAAVMVVVASVLSLEMMDFWSFAKDKWYTPRITKVIKSNPAGQRLTFQLPDGSMVNLNAESSLSFPSQFGDSVRMVELRGEAYFEVKKQEQLPFVVRTETISTKVIGTSFNVNAFPEDEDVVVSLVQGKVQVIAADPMGELESKIILKPSEKFTVNKQSLRGVKGKFDPVVETGWKDGILVFDNDSYQTVLAKLNRWYGVDIKTTNSPIDDWRIKGRFRNVSLGQFLRNLEYTHGITYEIDEKHVMITF